MTELNEKILLRDVPLAVFLDIPERKDFTAYEVYKNTNGSYSYTSIFLRNLLKLGIIIPSTRYVQKGLDSKQNLRAKPYILSPKGIKIKRTVKLLVEEFK